MLGVAPDNCGLLLDSDVVRLRELGDALRTRYSKNLAPAHTPAKANLTVALDSEPALHRRNRRIRDLQLFLQPPAK